MKYDIFYLLISDKMKILLGILLMGCGILCLINLIAYIWTFEIIYLRLWLTALGFGFYNASSKQGH